MGLLFLLLDRVEVGGQSHAPAALSVVQETGRAVGRIKTGAENLFSTGIRFPGRPASSEVLY
jgi:hypothetical protein